MLKVILKNLLKSRVTIKDTLTFTQPDHRTTSTLYSNSSTPNYIDVSLTDGRDGNTLLSYQ